MEYKLRMVCAPKAARIYVGWGAERVESQNQ
jgi:hypothetical protein